MIRRFSYFGAPDEVSSEAKPSSQEKQLRQLCRGEMKRRRTRYTSNVIEAMFVFIRDFVAVAKI